ncbi:iron ABC transporter substrate-binding protein [Shewanella sp. NFH-SH190041]|uniref:ABC transporter substrate-binding protein n=1 Tax=Shewanella sp. NFH-SH190041 TaxID=2950245 RepID=UPI0021C2BC36|nr:ABC transporter substrate-binding protein [Shewanella sp. NFH-SH190041]BDM65349.1 iron ABC transporter substrate-binding protein [Shewanella sp. NFH-SH190041]
MNRRQFLQACFALGGVTCLPSFVMAGSKRDLLVTTGTSNAASAGIRRIISAGGPADLLLMSLCPDKLLGYANISPQALVAAGFMPQRYQKPKLGRLSGKNTQLSLEALLQLQPDLVVDCGTVNTTYRSLAERLTAQTGIACVLVDGQLSDTPTQYRQLGALIGEHPRAEFLASKAEQILSQATQFSRQQYGRRFYFARGANGLETGTAGSIHTQAVELLGLENVVSAEGFHGLGKVSLEQIIAWQPDCIIAQDPQFIRDMQHHPLWQSLPAVKQGQFFAFPQRPFGWLDFPPGINRLLGLQLLQSYLINGAAIQPATVSLIQTFMQDFFQTDLSLQQTAQLLDA